MKKLKINLSKSSIIICGILLITALLIHSLNLVVIAASICILYRLFRPLVSESIFDSKAFYSTLVIFCYIILLQCTVLIAWVINHNLPLSLTPALLLLIILLLVAYKIFVAGKNSIDSKPSPLKPFNVPDIIAISISCAICGAILFMPLLDNPKIDTKTTIIMSLVDGNVDDAAHFGLINDHLYYDRGVLPGSNATNTRYNGFYPVGWHSVSAVLIKTIYPSIKTGTASLWTYAIQKLFWSFVMFYLLIRSTFALLKFTKNSKKSGIVATYWAACATALLGIILLLPIIREGFYSLFPQLITALLAMPLILQACADKNSHHNGRIFPVILLVFIGGCLSWLLPLPAFAIATSLIVGFLLWDKNVKTTAKNLWNIVKQNALLIIIPILSVLVQVFVMATNKTGGSVSFFQGIILDGGITKYGGELFLCLFTGLILFLLLADKHVKKIAHILIILSASLLIYCFFIYLIQMKFIGQTAYYFYKTIDILIITLIPFCVVGIGAEISKVCAFGKRITLDIILCTAFLVIAAMTVGPSISTLAYAGGFRDFSLQVGSSLLDELDTTLADKNYGKSYVFYYMPGDKYFVQNEIANIIAKSNEPDSNCFNDIRHTIWVSPQMADLVKRIQSECKDYDVTVITDKGYYDDFMNKPESAIILTGNVKVKYY